MLMRLGHLASQDAPVLQQVLEKYELDLGKLPNALELMLDLELFILSYQIVSGRAPDLNIDWWGHAIDFLE